jgi:hypothetical protein
MDLPDWGKKKYDMRAELEAILLWAEDHTDFDTGFIEDLWEKHDKFGGLTEGQKEAVENIMAKWEIT